MDWWSNTPPCFLLQSMFLHVSFSFSLLLPRHSSAVAKTKYTHRGDGGEVAWAVCGMFYRSFLVIGLFFHPTYRKRKEKAQLILKPTKYDSRESKERDRESPWFEWTALLTLRKGKTQQNTSLHSAQPWGSLSSVRASTQLSSMKRWRRKHRDQQNILTTRVASDDELSGFIIHEYEERVWESTQPPGRPVWERTQWEHRQQRHSSSSRALIWWHRKGQEAWYVPACQVPQGCGSAKNYHKVLCCNRLIHFWILNITWGASQHLCSSRYQHLPTY